MQQLVGSIFRVPLNERYRSYAQFLADESFAFYDSFRSGQAVDLAALIASPVLFRTHLWGLCIPNGLIHGNVSAAIRFQRPYRRLGYIVGKVFVAETPIRRKQHMIIVALATELNWLLLRKKRAPH